MNNNTLILNGEWLTDPVPGESLYRIARYDGLAIASVGRGQRQRRGRPDRRRDPGIDATASGSVVADYDTITAVIEGGDGDHLGERDALRVRLSQKPIDDASVDVMLVYDGIQLELQDLNGVVIPGGTLHFTTGNWDKFQTVVVVALHDSLREGFHTSLIQFVTTSANADQPAPKTDDFNIPSNAPVEFVGLSRQPSSITSVIYNGQTLQEFDPLGTNTGTAAAPNWELINNKILFRGVGGELTKVVGNDLHIKYLYEIPGFNNVFTSPVLVRINDADAATVLVRETGGSTDVVEGAASFLIIQLDGTQSFAVNSLVDRTITVSGGQGAGQSATIVGNTSDTITIDQVWAVSPDGTSTFALDDDPGLGISVPGAVTGDLSASYERDPYEISLVAGVSYTFDLEGSPTGKGSLSDPYLRVFDNTGRQVAYDDDGGVGYNSHLVYTPSVSGSYSLSAGAIPREPGPTSSAPVSLVTLRPRSVRRRACSCPVRRPLSRRRPA